MRGEGGTCDEEIRRAVLCLNQRLQKSKHRALYTSFSIKIPGCLFVCCIEFHVQTIFVRNTLLFIGVILCQ